MNTEKEFAPGKEVISLCGKCKLALAHVIIAMNRHGSIAKCECKTCGAVHRFKDPDAPVKADVAVKKVRAAKKEVLSSESIWNKAIAGKKSPASPYSMSAGFLKGGLIEHPNFGQGVVEELIGSNKIRVVFKDGEKILVHNSKGA